MFGHNNNAKGQKMEKDASFTGQDSNVKSYHLMVEKRRTQGFPMVPEKSWVGGAAVGISFLKMAKGGGKLATNLQSPMGPGKRPDNIVGQKGA